MSARRSRFLAGASAFASVGILRFPAGAAEFTYKYANDNPLNHPMTASALWWAERVRQESGGQMQIDVFPNSVLGSDPAMLTQMRINGIQFLHYTGDLLASIVPVAEIDALCFAYRGDDILKALDGDLGAHIRGEIEKTGVHIFNRCLDNGYREMTNNIRPIATPADMKGMKIRIPPSKIISSTMVALGATPVSISIAEVYTALQTHLVDGEENDYVGIDVHKFYEVQKYCSVTDHRWAGWWLLANVDAWAKLPKKLQDIVASAYDRSVDRERVDHRKQNDALQPKLKADGMVFNTPDLEPFRAQLRAAGYFAQWKNEFGARAWSLLEKYTGKLA